MSIDSDQVINKSDLNSTEQYVTFLINNETYAIEVMRVKEIVGVTSITPIPNSENYLKGVINLRGIVVPVLDLRIKFNISGKEYDSSTVILILEMKKYIVGVIVDSVTDVITAPGQLQDVPNFHVSIDRDVIKGVFNKESNLIIILDADVMLTQKDLQIFEELKEV